MWSFVTAAPGNKYTALLAGKYQQRPFLRLKLVPPAPWRFWAPDQPRNQFMDQAPGAFGLEDHRLIHSSKLVSRGTSLAVQWLGLHASTTGGLGSIPARGTKIPQVHSQKKKKTNSAGSWLRLAGPGKLKQTVVLEARKGEEGSHRSGCHRGKALLGPLSLAHASPPARGVPPECWSWVGVEAPTGE